MTQAVRAEAEVLERLRALFVGQFHAEVTDADTDLLASGVLDSLRLVELLLHIEQTFAVRVPVDSIELDDLRTLRGLATLIAARRDPFAPPAARAANGAR